MLIKSNQNWLTKGFTGCSLAELNQRAEMLTRIDNKYILRTTELEELKSILTLNFDLLTIGENRTFCYSTRYYDTDERSAYYEHHQGKRKGFKVRVRRYLESGLCYVELKMKQKRGTTVKLRRDYNFDNYGSLDQAALQFVKNEYQNHYNKPFEYNVEPVMDVAYQRLTLVSKDGQARMTIDTDLTFNNGKLQKYAPTGFFIVETKSNNGRGLADMCLRMFNHRPIKRCSKYCIGMASLSEVSRFNHFMPAMHKLHIWDSVETQTDRQEFAA
jgi:hypothetical protein